MATGNKSTLNNNFIYWPYLHQNIEFITKRKTLLSLSSNPCLSLLAFIKIY